MWDAGVADRVLLGQFCSVYFYWNGIQGWPGHPGGFFFGFSLHSQGRHWEL